MNITLIIAACLSAIAALLHLAIIVGGASWYRFFGAGEKMALAAEAGKIYPTVITTGIALVLALWAAYALAGAGVATGGFGDIGRLPYLKLALVGITAIYLLRGLAIFALFMFARHHVSAFWVWSSLICLGFGGVHLLGVYQVSNTL